MFRAISTRNVVKTSQYAEESLVFHFRQREAGAEAALRGRGRWGALFVQKNMGNVSFLQAAA